MAFVHGKNTVVKLAAKDLSAYANASELARTADSHDVTTYGKNDHVFSGGLGNATASISGIYDTTAVTGPRAAIVPMIGTVVTFIRQPEGTGTGKPQDSVSVLVTGYTETNPVADMVTWSVSLQCSDAVNTTAQS
jgi:hypothetical protein